MTTVPIRRTLPVLRGRAGRFFTAMALAAAGAACSESPLDPLVEHGAPGSLQTAGRMPTPELRAEQVSDSGVVVRWTEVDDGTGAPAAYTVRYASPRLAWTEGKTVCEVVGRQVGEEQTCSIEDLEPGRRYEFQLRAYRAELKEPAGASFSNLVAVETETPTPAAEAPAPRSTGIWISPAELLERPMSGAGWRSVLDAATGDCGRVDLSDQEDMTNVCVLAKAMVFVRTGKSGYRDDVLDALEQIADLKKYEGRALALGRELGAYVMAADLVDLQEVDEALDERFREALDWLRRTRTSSGPKSLIDCHERRPNNWGAHCGASRIAVAIYLGDREDLERAAKVFRGYIGDRSAYAGFTYGADLSWQCDPKKPVGINPAGCKRDGLSLDGVLADDQRRGGKFTTRPPRENYVWEALQGLLAQAVMLQREGYDAFEWEDRALLRAARWLHDVNGFPAEGDDVWQAAVLNHYYGTSFPVAAPGKPGKNVAWAYWSHS